MGKRPDRATIVYCNLIRQSFRDVPILLAAWRPVSGGWPITITGLTRCAVPSCWTPRRTCSLYGMGERSIREVADGLNSGLAIEDMTYIDGTVYRTRALDDSLPTLILPDFEALRKSPRQYAESFRIQYRNTDPFTAKRLAEPYGKEFVVQNPPQKPLTQAEMDGVYDLPLLPGLPSQLPEIRGRPRHPGSEVQPGVQPGLLRSLLFCALTFHQGGSSKPAATTPF